MTDRVTWAQCPRCGRRAAVGWTALRWAGSEPREEVAEEYDCASGCDLEPEELREVFSRAS